MNQKGKWAVGITAIIAAVCVIVGLVSLQLVRQQKREYENNMLTAFSKYYNIESFGACGASGLALVTGKDEEGHTFYGVINENYEVVIPCIYDEINHFVDDFAIVKLHENYALINTEGELIRHLPYRYINKEENVFVARTVDDDVLISGAGTELSKHYRYITYADGCFVASCGDSEVLLNSRGTEISKHYSDIRDYEYPFVAEVESNNYVLLDSDGDELSKYYDHIYGRSHGGYFKVEKDGEYGYVNSSGREIVYCIYDWSRADELLEEYRENQ